MNREWLIRGCELVDGTHVARRGEVPGDTRGKEKENGDGWDGELRSRMGREPERERESMNSGMD